MVLLVLFFILVGLISRCPAPGIDREFAEKVDKIHKIEGMDPKKAQEREYYRYLLRVLNGLKEDEAYKKRGNFTTKTGVNEGKLTNGLYEELSAVTREKLNKLKLAEIEFQEQLLKADKTHMLERTDNEWNPIHQEDKTFSQKDLDLLLGRYQDLVRIRDAERREKFNEHQMEKELKHRESLEKAKSDLERKMLEEKEKQRHEKKHERLHQPLSGPQLRELWARKEGLDPEYFDLKTLFKLHDVNGDGHLDEFELETMFLADLDKAYNPDDPDVDVAERDEELERMRETAMTSVDSNGDGRVSLDEFLEAKRKADFENNEEYKPLYEDGDEFDEEELSEYKESRFSQEPVASVGYNVSDDNR